MVWYEVVCVYLNVMVVRVWVCLDVGDYWVVL